MIKCGKENKINKSKELQLFLFRFRIDLWGELARYILGL